MDWLVGDLQGCCDAFDRLLDEIGYSPSRDRLWVLGDLVNRGPCSLATLERLRALGDSATCLLGNHDWHLLAAAYGVRPQHKSDTFDDVLRSPERDAWLEWLRQRPMVAEAHGWLLVHAGLAPQWDAPLAIALARELEQALRTEPLPDLLPGLFGNEPARWRDDLDRTERLRFTLNALTRIRYVHADGTLDFKVKEGRGPPPAGLYRWFDAPKRRHAGTRIAFGHWSTLGLVERDDVMGLDTGCVWGGRLTAVRVDGGRREVVQVECEAAQAIG
jgi:bis(5'-nucleosyl)-tetraphosphatase (symmetrical)